MDLIKYRKWWYLLSLLIIIPGTISLMVWGLKPSIDFTGGTQLEFAGTTDKTAVEKSVNNLKIQNISVYTTESGIIVRTSSIDQAKQAQIKSQVEGDIKGAKEVRVDTVGPSISKDITISALILVLAASAVVVSYIAYSFRKVPKPANSFEFGLAAIIALLHDALVVLGIFSILGHFFNVEVDPLFITAILTVIGFSVHDTIVIFDRIRENLIRGSYGEFENTVAVSVWEMLPRTINTSFLVWVILLVLYLFGGTSIKYFVLALLVGIFSGTYSSILNASPLLVTWQDFKRKRRLRKIN